MPYYIAEIGSCHDHNAEATGELIDELCDMGVDAIKLQYWSDSESFARQRNRLDLAKVYEQWETRLSFVSDIAEYTTSVGLNFICSVFLPQDCEVLQNKVDHFKIASIESHNMELIRAASVHSNGRALIVSTGCSQAEDFVYYNSLRNSATLSCPILLLHCIAAYPTKIEDLNLRVIQNYRLDGFSDHSGHVLAGAAAVLHGAKYLEFHVRHEKTPTDCPDYPHSLTAEQVRQYIQNCRDVLAMRGSFLRPELEAESPYRGMRS